MSIFAKFLNLTTNVVVVEEPIDKLKRMISRTIIQSLDTELSSRAIVLDSKRLGDIVDLLYSQEALTEPGNVNGCTELFIKDDVLGSLFELSVCDHPTGIRDDVKKCIH